MGRGRDNDRRGVVGQSELTERHGVSAPDLEGKGQGKEDSRSALNLRWSLLNGKGNWP